jgi:GWxTD domain-containing protein
MLLGASSAWAQKNAPDQDPLSRPRKEKQELKKAYKDWLEKDVPYIITSEEKKAFLKLTTDEEREQFIESFWKRRDPDPDTVENEYKEAYYERISYANEHFTSGIPGWKTDRGRIYIVFGKPDEIESHPAGGYYERPDYEGGGSTSTYPFETWFYRYLEGVGSGIEIEFVDPTGSGEYHIARSPDEKDALLNVPGAGLTLAEQLGLADKGDRIAGSYGFGSQNAMREQDQPFERLRIITDLSRAPAVKYNDIVGDNTSTPSEDANPLNFNFEVDFFRQSSDKVITTFTVQADNKDLSFKDVGGIQTATMNIYGKITSVALRKAGTFEDPVQTTASVDDLSQAKERKSAYQKAVALAPGVYKVDVIVRDVVSGATGIKHVGFTVPRYDDKRLMTSSLILAAVLKGVGSDPTVGQFVIGPYKVIPNISGSYHRGEPVGIYMQIYNAGIDQTTLRPAVDVDYVLLKGGKEIVKQPENWQGLSDSGQRLTLARLMPTSALTPGEYELQIRTHDRVSGQTITSTGKFTVTP